LKRNTSIKIRNSIPLFRYVFLKNTESTFQIAIVVSFLSHLLLWEIAANMATIGIVVT